MKLSREQRHTLRNLLKQRDVDLIGLSQIAGLEPARDFRDADWRGVNFGANDLSGYDFSGSDLTWADFSRAQRLHNAIWADVITDGATRWPPGRSRN